MTLSNKLTYFLDYFTGTLRSKFAINLFYHMSNGTLLHNLVNVSIQELT